MLKEKPHILFLTHYFPPESNAPANRTYEHAKIWVNKVDVTIVTNFPNHPDGKIYHGYKNRLLYKETIDGINVVRIFTFATPNEGFLLRSLNFIIYMIGAFLFSVFTRLKFDVVIATTPQFFCGLAGKYAAKIRRKPFILELRDLWPESIIAVGALKNKTLIRFLERVELNLYKSADKIISVTNSFKKNLISRGIEEEKINVFFNGVSLDTFINGKQITHNDLRNFLDKGFTIGYIGTIGLAHSIKTVIDAAEKMKDEDVNFVIVGSGAERSKLENIISERNLNNIKIFPIQPKNEIPSIIKKLDLFCVHLKKDPLFETVIPSKLFEGMVMKKPILLGVNGESRKIIENAECGIYFEPENSNDLVEKISLLHSDEKKSDSLGKNGYKYVLENFNRKQIASDYLNTILELLR